MNPRSVVLVSSTIFPNIEAIYWTDPTLIKSGLRLEQTKATVQSLLSLGYEEIFIADNSGPNWESGTERCLAPATVLRFQHQQFFNKGISELFLLRSAVPHLPSQCAIVKLSGRYVLKQRLETALGSLDCVFRLYRGGCDEDGRRGGMNYRHVSTIAYVVREKALLSELLVRTLRELFAYPSRIVGPRSFFRLLKNSLFPRADRYSYNDPPIAIELAMERVLRMGRYRVSYVNELGVEGVSGQDARTYVE